MKTHLKFFQFIDLGPIWTLNKLGLARCDVDAIPLILNFPSVLSTFRKSRRKNPFSPHVVAWKTLILPCFTISHQVTASTYSHHLHLGSSENCFKIPYTSYQKVWKSHQSRLLNTIPFTMISWIQYQTSKQKTYVHMNLHDTFFNTKTTNRNEPPSWLNSLAKRCWSSLPCACLKRSRDESIPCQLPTFQHISIIIPWWFFLWRWTPILLKSTNIFEFVMANQGELSEKIVIEPRLFCQCHCYG